MQCLFNARPCPGALHAVLQGRVTSYRSKQRTGSNVSVRDVAPSSRIGSQRSGGDASDDINGRFRESRVRSYQYSSPRGSISMKQAQADAVMYLAKVLTHVHVYDDLDVKDEDENDQAEQAPVVITNFSAIQGELNNAAETNKGKPGRSAESAVDNGQVHAGAEGAPSNGTSMAATTNSSPNGAKRSQALSAAGQNGGKQANVGLNGQGSSKGLQEEGRDGARAGHVRGSANPTSAGNPHSQVGARSTAAGSLRSESGGGADLQKAGGDVAADASGGGCCTIM